MNQSRLSAPDVDMIRRDNSTTSAILDRAFSRRDKPAARRKMKREPLLPFDLVKCFHRAKSVANALFTLATIVSKGS